MDLQVILTGLAVRAAQQADRMASWLVTLDPTSDAVDPAHLWPAVALLQETAGIAATLAATGPVGGGEGPGAREVLPAPLRASQDLADVIVGKLAGALELGYDPDEDDWTVDQLLDVVREHVQRSVHLVTLERLRTDLRVALGDLPRETSDERIVGIARSMREERDRLRKAEVHAHGVQHDGQRRAHTELINVAKALGTYAPGMDDMSDDELRTTVHTIARQVLADHETQSRHAEQWRSTVADVAVAVGLGRGADRPEILRALSEMHERAYGIDSWSNWADEMANALGTPAADDDTTWTDEGLGLLVDKAREAVARSGQKVVQLGQELHLDPATTTWSAMLGRVRELYSRPRGVGVDDLAAALGDDTPAATSDWPHLLDRVRDLAARTGARHWVSVDTLAEALGRQSGPPATGDLTDYVAGLLDEVRELQNDVKRIPDNMRTGLARALAPVGGVDLTAVEWPVLLDYAAALAKRENGRPTAPPVSAPAVGPLEAKRVPAGPSVDDFSGVNRGEPA